MKIPNKKIINCRPDSEHDLSKLAESTIRKADALGVLPTPVDQLVAAAKIKQVGNITELNEGFLTTLKKDTIGIFESMVQKIRGIADLREKVIYVPSEEKPSRILFPKAHELGHQVIPWHKVDPTYIDDDKTLGFDAERLFDQEANFFASEIIFQGKNFRKHALDYTASLDAVFKLSDLYGTSIHATIWRYVEEQDETIAVAQYYPINIDDDYGSKVLNHWKMIPSLKFKKKFSEIELPAQLRTGHPWVAARDHNTICNGEDRLSCAGSKEVFLWQAWWNGYTLFVFLRRKPKLSLAKS